MLFQRSSFLSPVPFIVCIMLLAGALTGKWAADRFHLMDEESDMNLYMSVLMKQANRIVDSARVTLDKMNSSNFPICSQEDKHYMREVLFSAYNIKDIGRLQNDILQCSAFLSDVTTEGRRSREDVSFDDGTYVYQDRELITTGSHGSIFGRDQANVVLSTVAFDALHIQRYNFAVFIHNENKTQFAQLYGYPATFTPDFGNLFATLEGTRFDDNEGLFQLRSCDPASNVCIVITTSADMNNTSDRLLPLVFISLGMLVGGGLAMGWNYYRNRDRSLISLLKKALAAKELTLVYQPVVNIGNRSIIGFEALIRWEITKGDFIPPDLFVARAEEHGIADKITLYVLDCVINEMGRLLRKKRSLYININITASDLQSPDFMRAINERLVAAKIKPEQIGLELTERTAVDFAKAREGISILRKRGHKVYIDDFGIGYSSLAYLGELQVDAIKIDKSFTRTIGDDVDAVSIVPQIISMAHQHGLGIVVEGVETEAQVNYLQGICTNLSGQGWYFGKPVDAAAVAALAGSAPSSRKRRQPGS
ncbi:EAL domain-containing protein [Brucella gallinifaecis]|uniref:cyclic-guanylate-specific phosphodiesterase n=1 Tax=Brucella gallinifaecis TaxID=215590 RepID=A0A502BPL2_9HYPH|nr:EAL domain-containing protein [Brucella gallinifaecis]TPF76124.1 EAL domain-containing protein [Brucella gallinifaecis]